MESALIFARTTFKELGQLLSKRLFFRITTATAEKFLKTYQVRNPQINQMFCLNKLLVELVFLLTQECGLLPETAKMIAFHRVVGRDSARKDSRLEAIKNTEGLGTECR